MWLRFGRVSAIGFVDAVQTWRLEGRPGSRTALSAALRSLRGRRAAFAEALENGEGAARVIRIARRALARSALRAVRDSLGGEVRREEQEALLAFAAETAPEVMPRWGRRWIRTGSRLGPVPRGLLDAVDFPLRAWRRLRELRWEFGRRWPHHLR